jgi:hypothetical protein
LRRRSKTRTLTHKEEDDERAEFRERPRGTDFTIAGDATQMPGIKFQAVRLIALMLCKPRLKANAPIMFQGASDIVSNSMKLFREQEALLGCFSVLLLLSGCGGAEPECGSLDTRNSVVKIVSDDSNNALVNYAVKNSDAVAAKVSNTNTEADKLAIWEKARQGAVYTLDDTIRMNSRNRATRAVTCSGLLYVTVAETTAQGGI